MISLLDIKQWFRGNKVVGLHLQLQDNSQLFSYCELLKVKAAVDVSSSGIVEYIDQLSTPMFTKVPAYLSIDGKGVMHFKVDHNSTIADALSTILPNVKMDDFYIQEKVEQDKKWISFIRKDQLTRLINELDEKGLKIIEIVLGAFPVANYSRVFDEPKDELNYQLYDRQWAFRGSELEVINKTEGHAIEYKVDENISLASECLLPFLHALAFFGVNTDINAQSIESIEINHNEYFQKRVFQLGGWSVLLFFFLALLINFFLFEHYQEVNKNLEAQLSGKKELLDKRNEINQQLEQKRDFIAKSGFSASVKLSYLADRIAALVPSSISLEEMKINPVQMGEYKKYETPIFDLGQVILAGNVSSSYDLNDWIKVMQTQEWIQSVDIMSYDFVENKKKGVFTIKLTLKD